MKKRLTLAFLLCFSVISFSQTSFLAMDPSNYSFPDVSAFHKGKLLGKTNKKGMITIPKFPAGDTIVFQKDDLLGIFVILSNPEKGTTYIASLEAHPQAIEEIIAPDESENWAAAPPPPPIEKEVVKTTGSEMIFDIVDEVAEFPGGNVALKTWITKNLKYPPAAKEKSIQGKCFVKFIVEKDGSITQVVILKGVTDCLDCDKEAVRVIKMMPKWKPGKINGAAVRSSFNLPIAFVLDK